MSLSISLLAVLGTLMLSRPPMEGLSTNELRRRCEEAMTSWSHSAA